MIGERPDVRRATRADIDGVAAALARAFHNVPVMHWFFPEERDRPRRIERVFRMRVAALLKQDEIYTTDDHAGGAVWAQPDRWEVPPLEGLAFVARLLPMVRTRIGLLARGWGMIDRMHPKEPHWYLAILGTEPDTQGHGIGSALMHPVLDDCDRNGVAAYLESSKETNLAFYGRHGFRVTGELRLPDGPVIWPMWREPRSSI